VSSKIIVVCNQKGGSCKTTTSMTLAGALGRSGARVCVIDADPQGSAQAWSSMAGEEPFPAAVIGLGSAGDQVHREIQKHRDHYDFIIVDCPPAVDQPQPQSALLIADLAIVTAQPSIIDLNATVAMIKKIEQIRVINERLIYRVLLTRVKSKKNAESARQELTKVDLPTLKSVVKDREAYKLLPVIGGTIDRYKGSGKQDAVAETAALAKEVLALLTNATRSRATATEVEA